MRARNLKPGLFKNELLATSGPLNTVIFCGLWCLADREGRLEDRPRGIHLALNPGRPYASTTLALHWLSTHGFIVRYQVCGAKYIAIPQFRKHQFPHTKEPKSTIPAPYINSVDPVPEPDENSSSPSESPIPHPLSPIPHPESPIPHSVREEGSALPVVSQSPRNRAPPSAPHPRNGKRKTVQEEPESERIRKALVLLDADPACSIGDAARMFRVSAEAIRQARGA